MESKRLALFFALCVSVYLFAFISIAVADDHQNKLQNYIIFVHGNFEVDISNSEEAKAWHISLLSSVCKDSPNSRFIYSYNQIANGFAARLTKEEVQEMSQKSWFDRAILANKSYKLTTTYTPEFLHLSGPKATWRSTKNMGEGVIICLIDGGISPGHPSFDDKDMPPPPAKWKGHCDFNSTICNNKLIGAKSFLNAGADEKKHISPIDTTGHGTHTASTAAGAFVNATNMFGDALGIASGMAPRAHIAVYRICFEHLCELVDAFKAFEAAVNDGCDVLSISLGDDNKVPVYEDITAKGGFYAMSKGVFFSASGGNDGPKSGSIMNDAPWLLTVAASTTDRKFRSIVQLGNGFQIEGESGYQQKSWVNKMIPVVYIVNDNIVGKCMNENEKEKCVRGKIVVIDLDNSIGTIAEIGEAFLKGGVVGLILVGSSKYGFMTYPDDNVLPYILISYDDGANLKKYIYSTKNPIAVFHFKGTSMHNPWSPSIAGFSSRGPSSEFPLILKPDITGPGVGIIAAMPPKFRGGKKIEFGLMSGTSMSCPHLSGIAALIKHAHPNWSPAIIKSAIMTTSYVTNLDGKPISDERRLPADAYGMGAGHVDAQKALDPGLVYDLTSEDYIKYLCGLGYKDSQVSNIVFPAPPVKCAKVKAISQEQLNYPSISVHHQVNGTTIVFRTVTNVGDAKATYKPVVNVPKGVSVNVEPNILQFNQMNEKKSFKIIFKWSGIKNRNWASGDLKWVSNKYVVRSPIVIVNHKQ